jgi:hypothetical protein
MFEVSGLSMGELPYEEYIPGAEELQILRRDAPQLYEAYWELLCHYHICLQLNKQRSGGISQKVWANYLFPGLEDKAGEISRLEAVSSDEVNESPDF